jgi:hypothetical protein
MEESVMITEFFRVYSCLDPHSYFVHNEVEYK